MDGREYRKSVFEHSQKMIEESEKIKNSLNKSLEKQKIYIYNKDYNFELGEKKFKTNIVISKNRTMEAGRAWSKKGNTAVLNFASATNPGGGVLGGSSAQEECLCRVSTLYNCLNTKDCWDKYYNPNRAEANVLHNNNIIYTPKVVGFKDDDYHILDEKDYFYVDVISCAAPNLRDKPNNGWCNQGESNTSAKISDEELFKIHKERAEFIFNIAKENNIRNLVLGAFGCGAFKNNPEVVAKAYKEVLKEFDGYFENIEFAIYCSKYDAQNYIIFKKVLTSD